MGLKSIVLAAATAPAEAPRADLAGIEDVACDSVRVKDTHAGHPHVDRVIGDGGWL